MGELLQFIAPQKATLTGIVHRPCFASCRPWMSIDLVRRLAIFLKIWGCKNRVTTDPSMAPRTWDPSSGCGRPRWFCPVAARLVPCTAARSPPALPVRGACCLLYQCARGCPRTSPLGGGRALLLLAFAPVLPVPSPVSPGPPRTRARSLLPGLSPFACPPCMLPCSRPCLIP